MMGNRAVAVRTCQTCCGELLIQISVSYGGVFVERPKEQQQPASEHACNSEQQSAKKSHIEWP